VSVPAQLRAAFAAEWLKFRRARVPWVAAALLVAGVLGITLAARSAAGSAGIAGGKARLLLATSGPYPWGAATQVGAVGALLTIGIVFGWLHGQEYEEGRLETLFARPVSRGAVAIAKVALQGAWTAALALALAAGTAGLAAVTAQPFGASEAELAGRLIAVVLLDGCLASLCVLAAVVTRSTLGALAAAVVLVAAAQIAALLGAGGWFPLSAPGIWSAQVRPAVDAGLAVGLAGAVALGVLASAATVIVWARRDIA
jgi:ABC-type transport system involved in multi-copper enzyme maturation permease subunit